MEKVVTFSHHGEAILHIFIIFEVLVPKSGNNVALFYQVGVLCSYSSLNSGSVTFSVFADRSEVFVGSLDRLNHIEELQEINDTVLVAVVFLEDSVNLVAGQIAVAHVFQHLRELACLDGFVGVFVVVLECLHNL